MVKLVENRDKPKELETPPPSKRPRRSVTQQKKTETPKKEEPKRRKWTEIDFPIILIGIVFVVIAIHV